MSQMHQLAQHDSPCLWFAAERPVVGRVFIAHRNRLVVATKLADPPGGPSVDADGFVSHVRRALGAPVERDPDPGRWPFDLVGEPFEAGDLVDLSRLTSFQRSVLEVTARIPRGMCVTYGDVAKEIGCHHRPVGGAMDANPAPLVIPCHRVVAKHDLGGWVYGEDLKRKLLAHEGANLSTRHSRSARLAPTTTAVVSLAPRPSLEERIRDGESQHAEFKPHAGLRTGKIYDRHEIVKSVCGFLNAEGGELIVGVEDDGSLRGLASEHQTGKQFDRDFFLRFVQQDLLKPHLTQYLSDLVEVLLKEYRGATICVVNVEPSPHRPVYAQPLAKDGDSWGTPDVNKWTCWVREGPATPKYEGQKLSDYILRRWSK